MLATQYAITKTNKISQALKKYAALKKAIMKINMKSKVVAKKWPIW